MTGQVASLPELLEAEPKLLRPCEAASWFSNSNDPSKMDLEVSNGLDTCYLTMITMITVIGMITMITVIGHNAEWLIAVDVHLHRINTK